LRLCSILVVALLPAVCAAESLGDAAKREEDRRAKNKEQGVEAKTFTSDDVKTATPTPVGSSAKSAPQNDAPRNRSDSSEETAGQERAWRQKYADAQARIDKAQKAVDFANKVWDGYGSGDYYVNKHGGISSRTEVVERMKAAAKTELETAQKAMESLEEEARRAGVPPGWLR
jgi:hypothetical protein